MFQAINPGTNYVIAPEHCEEIEKANCEQDCSNLQEGGLEVGGDCPCCFFCVIPPLEDRCAMSPQLCGGGYANPPTGYCYFRQTTVVLTGTVEYHYPYGTFIHSGDIFTISTIDCYVYSLTGGSPGEGSGEGDSWAELPGDGPIVFVRSRYPDGASGSMLVTGVARDDEYGVSDLSFWIDGRVAQVQDLRTGLYDPYTCNERPAAGCDAHSRFEATLDVSALADGPHTLQVLATNGRTVDPIPTYYEIPFEVANVGSCASDTTAPSVSLTAPAAGAVVQGAVSVACSASDASEISAVGLYAGGAWQRDDNTAPFGYTLDTSAFTDGPLELRCRAEDVCGNDRFSAPVTVTVANGTEVTTVFAPTDDTFSHQDHPDSVFGAYNFLRLRTIDGGHGRHGYLRFQVTGLEGPVVSARLRLRTQETAIPESIGVYKLLETAWSEGTLTWSNAPLTVLQSVQLPPPFAENTWHELDVTPLVTGNGTHSFGLATGANQGQLDLWSKESVYAPELVVVTVPSAAPGPGER